MTPLEQAAAIYRQACDSLEFHANRLEKAQDELNACEIANQKAKQDLTDAHTNLMNTVRASAQA